ncbi:MAG: DUF192 domain-containing protein, partial [Pseudomonadota bacterium]
MFARIVTNLSLALLLALALPGCISAQEPDVDLSSGFQSSPLTVATSAGRVHRFTVYLALSPDQMRRGLMFVRELPEDEG